MILSEKQLEWQEKFDSLRKRIDLLDSHKTVNLINSKQYDESMRAIVQEIEELEKENGIEDNNVSVNENLMKISDILENIEFMINELSKAMKKEISNEQLSLNLFGEDDDNS